MLCSLTVAEARKGYVGGAPVALVLGACCGDVACIGSGVTVGVFLVMSGLVCGLGAGFWLLCPDWVGVWG